MELQEGYTNRNVGEREAEHNVQLIRGIYSWRELRRTSGVLASRVGNLVLQTVGNGAFAMMGMKPCTVDRVEAIDFSMEW